MTFSMRSSVRVFAAGLALAIMTAGVSAASLFEGVWKVTDSDGKPFEITLGADGAAKATRGEGMVGTWKEDGSAAVVTWNTGWTTKIAKDGDKFTKSAYGKGQPADSKPVSTSAAEKAK